MDFEDLLYSIDRQVNDYMENASEVTAEDVGLDRRAAYRLFVKDNVIAVPKGNDRTLQYYGGFEYIDKEYRHELGDWVFYIAEDSYGDDPCRVQRCLDRLKEEVENEA